MFNLLRKKSYRQTDLFYPEGKKRKQKKWREFLQNIFLFEPENFSWRVTVQSTSVSWDKFEITF